ncbi:MAG TPA: DinB family protein [Terriglobia bacterium]|jgi:uncharacterized damage-inducible protein DinB|nr:DinB family protein [Terriglobia bacterium]
MPQLEDFIKTWDQEFQTNLRVFTSFPSNRLGYRPHEISKTALELMWVIVYEEKAIVEGCLAGNITFEETKPPKTKEALIRAYQKQHPVLVKKVKKAGPDLFSRTIKFFVAKGKMGDVKVGDVLWGLLHDQIHHRGQLSVYLRLVGAKVPSIYGPTADEPW